MAHFPREWVRRRASTARGGTWRRKGRLRSTSNAMGERHTGPLRDSCRSRRSIGLHPITLSTHAQACKIKIRSSHPHATLLSTCSECMPLLHVLVGRHIPCKAPVPNCILVRWTTSVKASV